MTYQEGVLSSSKTSFVKTIRPHVDFVVQSDKLTLNQDKFENKNLAAHSIKEVFLWSGTCGRRELE